LTRNALLNILYVKAQELGDDPSDEEAGEAFMHAKNDLLMHILHNNHNTSMP